MQEPHIASPGVHSVSANFPSQQDSLSSAPETEVPSKDLPSVSARRSSESKSGKISPLERWVNRIAMVLFVSLCAVFGALLVMLPWSPKWTDNYVLISYPGLRDFIENGFVRGMCTGLGVLDMWIGFSEATHYHETENRP
ncbi:MAG: hypothetical protein ACHP8A_07410 [Terriglobales bacterium]|jgi:hypothetical protein